jgi:hypothetical protein
MSKCRYVEIRRYEYTGNRQTFTRGPGSSGLCQMSKRRNVDMWKSDVTSTRETDRRLGRAPAVPGYVKCRNVEMSMCGHATLQLHGKQTDFTTGPGSSGGSLRQISMLPKPSVRDAVYFSLDALDASFSPKTPTNSQHIHFGILFRQW